MLGFMISCFHGGPKFRVNLIAVSKLKAGYLQEFFFLISTGISDALGQLKAIICGGNRRNQSFFKKLQIVENKSWLSDDETYLLFDYVHLLKTHSELVANGENTATSV